MQFAQAVFPAEEGSHFVSVTLTRSGDPSQRLDVNYATQDGTASGLKDYTAARGTLSFAPGETSRSFDVLLTDDGFQEADETIHIVLSDRAGGPLDTSERQGLIGELTANNTTAGRSSVLRKVAEDATLADAERNRAFVLMQYFGYLRRDPNEGPDTDYTGYDFWLTNLEKAGGNFVQAELVKAFISSIEYRRRFGQP